MADTNGVSQASVVPFRVGDTGIEVCLITTRKSRRWAFPKGRIRSDETVDEAALNEALEEAGLAGSIIGPPIGSYTYKKGRRKFAVTVLLMRVDHCHDKWKEAEERKRKWVAPAKARQLLDRPNLLRILDCAQQQLQSIPAVATPGLPIHKTNWDAATDTTVTPFNDGDHLN